MSENTAQRFNQLATNFLTSPIHQRSPTIEKLLEWTREENIKSICDIACGPGHLALSFHKRKPLIVGVDPSSNMLTIFLKQAYEKNIEARAIQAYAELIPLPDNSFDLVCSRLAPHHFTNIQQALREMVRITKPGGKVAIIDLEGYEDPDIDQLNHKLEILHDPTHIRSYKASEWEAFFIKAGLEILEIQDNLSEYPQGVSIERWCNIASSGKKAEQRIRTLLRHTPQYILDSMNIMEQDGEYYMPIRTLMIIGRKRGS